MKKEFIKKQEKLTNKSFSFFIRCDDKNKPTEVKADMWFELWESEKMNEILDLCEMHNLNYDFGFECFDNETSSSKEISIVSNNCINQ